MTTKVQRWGNSLAVRLPRDIAMGLNLEAGSSVAISLRAKNIFITPAVKKELSLSELLRDIKPENIHKEISFGKPVGREVW
ncbi:MAG: AbrB/MazE/SpoVT family DNA-binding domain-containing protein [Patescibacteria group bacterium]